MAIRSALLLLLSAFVFISALAAGEADDDEAALLAFKAAVIGSGDNDPLPSWNDSDVGGGICGWEGVSCGRKHRRVVALTLPSHNLAGALSPAVGNLSFLRSLNLSSNLFRGSIPSSIGRLARLQRLDLSYNTLTGELPVNLSSCASLLILRVPSNNLHGRIPAELGHKLTSLTELSLQNNSFLTGTIPVSIANMSSLLFLDLSKNKLEGSIPPELGSMAGLYNLTLAYNDLSGELPNSLYNLSSLKVFQVGWNMLSGTIPADIGRRFPAIEILHYSDNRFSGNIPPSISNLSATLKMLLLDVNSFSGYVPPGLGRLQVLTHLLLDVNKLEADDRQGWEFITFLKNCSQLQYLVLSNNSFTGKLPGSIANLSTSLQALYVGESRVSGVIPPNIGNLVGLKILNIGNCFVSGEIPDSIGRLENLSVLRLYNTGLSGLVPSSLGNLTQLKVLYISNSLEGPIPAILGNLKNLYLLDLSGNLLNGSIPREVFKLPALSYYLGLAYNSLSGPLPTEVGNLSYLAGLFLSGNQLSGNMPDSIGNCISLEALMLNENSFEGGIPQSLKNVKGLSLLHLKMNKLSGNIPDALCSIGALKQLYLDHNNLSGMIPSCLQNLTSLYQLDISFNDLHGDVPKGGVFANATSTLIYGNNGLCGGIPQLHLAPCSLPVHTSKRKLPKSLMATLTSVSTSMFLLVVAFIWLIRKKLRKRRESQHMPTSEEQYERISYQALSNGTNRFSEANLLGQGSYGTVYKCSLHDQDNIVAVKVFNIQQSRSTRSFVAECEALRRVRHRGLLKIITCCSSINHQGMEFKALVFEFMPNGSLNGWLHPESEMPSRTNTLSLEQRLHIAVDIMDALDYLHNYCQPPIIHCDIKPSNILLAADMSARVGDFGISRILPESVSRTLCNSNSTFGVKGSIGYVAPEYGEGSSVSSQGDVFSLGILLLEMFTGRSPVDDMFSGSFDLHKFSENALPERIWEIVDPTIWIHINAHNSTARSRIQNCLVSAIDLGVSCSKRQPRERMLMRDAAIKMRAIRDSYLKFARTLLVEHGVATSEQL